jgi:hypothetical protein
MQVFTWMFIPYQTSALPYTLTLPRHKYSIATFNPALELLSKKMEGERQKICSQLRSYVVFGNRAILFCKENVLKISGLSHRQAIDRLPLPLADKTSNRLEEEAWIVPLTNIHSKYSIQPIVTLPLVYFLSPVAFVASTIRFGFFRARVTDTQ